MSSSTSPSFPKAFHHKQPFNPDGDVFSNAYTRTMKNQPLDRWDKFVRESLQNSWDAKDSSDGSIDYSLAYTELDDQQVSVLRENVFGDDFGGIPQLRHQVQSGTASMLVVSDRGTSGLRGPTSASVSHGEHKDFTSFVRNFGRSDSKRLAGGTFGVGKAVFFVASEASTILIYSRTTDQDGNPSNRFIAMSNEDDFEENGVQYTGRHWWGVREVGGAEGSAIEYAEPFLGSAADNFASIFGLDQGFSEDRPYGTTIAVLNPALQIATETDPSSADLMRALADCLTRWAWPHMVDETINFTVSHKGDPVGVPKPERDPALKTFVKAYKTASEAPKTPKNQWARSFPDRTAEVWSLSPSRHLGTVTAIDVPAPIEAENTVLQIDISNHVALLREPRMVVQYYRGPVQRSEVNYCGTFISGKAADIVFARSEPEAHHEWNPLSLQDERAILENFWGSRSRANPVRIFFDKLESLLQSSGERNNLGGDRKHYQSLTALSDRFGSIVSNATSGTSPSVTPDSGNKGTLQKRPKSTPSATFEVVGMHNSDSDFVRVEFEAEVKIPGKAVRWAVAFRPKVVSDQGSIDVESLLDAGLPAPKIIRVDGPDIDGVSLREFEAEAKLPNRDLPIRIEVLQPKSVAVYIESRFTEDGAADGA